MRPLRQSFSIAAGGSAPPRLGWGHLGSFIAPANRRPKSLLPHSFHTIQHSTPSPLRHLPRRAPISTTTTTLEICNASHCASIIPSSSQSPPPSRHCHHHHQASITTPNSHPRHKLPREEETKIHHHVEQAFQLLDHPTSSICINIPGVHFRWVSSNSVFLVVSQVRSLWSNGQSLADRDLAPLCRDLSLLRSVYRLANCTLFTIHHSVVLVV